MEKVDRDAMQAWRNGAAAQWPLDSSRGLGVEHDATTGGDEQAVVWSDMA